MLALASEVSHEVLRFRIQQVKLLLLEHHRRMEATRTRALLELVKLLLLELVELLLKLAELLLLLSPIPIQLSLVKLLLHLDQENHATLLEVAHILVPL